MTAIATEYTFDAFIQKQFMPYSGRNRRFFDVAKNIAFSSIFPDYRHGAILVSGGKIYNYSCNKNNFCSFGNRFRKKNKGRATMHAELGAILGLDRSITSGSSVYVARISKNGNFLISKPCEMCYLAMKHVGVKKVFYSIDDSRCGYYKL